MDLRITKTKTAIINAFLSLRSKKPLEKITIKELCEQAMINKSTFYSHYGDIYELSDMLETEVVLSVIQSMDHPEYIFENPGEFTRQLFFGYLSQDNLIQILFSDNRSSRLVSKIDRAVKELAFEKYPQFRSQPAQNIGLTFAIYGGYYAYAESRNYDRDTVISILGEIIRKIGELLTLPEDRLN
ncbi:MAG: TetR/AcrR family transcriptional regulator [Hungatella sp.]|jgi:AcrR family transcriptional regulator|nr:TetR/AcrR family transcriptional regulator [Hungatella sp.]